MARQPGLNNFAGTLEVLAGGPLDARTVVSTKTDLTTNGTFDYAYVGMIVSVEAEGKAYILTNEDYTKIENWKEIGSGGSGGTNNYNDLNNKPSINNVILSGNKSLSDLDINIPLNTSDLINDSGFITKLVNDLTNYYLKSETYTKAEVNSAIGAITTIHFEVVEQLPTHDIDTNIIYLVPNESVEQNNIYNECIYINNEWEIIGNTQIDLSNYVQKSQIVGLIKNDGSIDTTQYISQHQDISGKQDADDIMTQADMQDIFSVLPVARNNYQKYSMQEQIVGEWIDGKPLYQITISIENPVNNARNQISGLNFTTLDNLVSIPNVSALSSTQSQRIVPHYFDSNSYFQVHVGGDGTSLYVTWSNVAYGTLTNLLVCFQYTKTTD